MQSGMCVAVGGVYAQEYLESRTDLRPPASKHVVGKECLLTRRVCVSVRNSCKRSVDWFPSFDRHLIPWGRRVGQGSGLAVSDERFWGWEVFKH